METTVTERIASPEFAVVVRGYDRGQVDEYLGELLAWLSEAERRIVATDEANESLRREVVQLRAAAASLEERAGVPGPQSLTAFSERMSQVMQSAVEAADELRAQAEREANERRDAVGAEVERMLERAKTEAREILRRARARERDLEENVAALAARRSAAVEELGRLHRQLAELLAAPEGAHVAGRDGGRDAGATTPAAAAPAESRRSSSDAAPALAAGGDGSPRTGRPGLQGAGVTQTLPAVEPAPSARTPEPTMVQHPADARDPSEGRDRRGG